jgi:hypothetical protein
VVVEWCRNWAEQREERCGAVPVQVRRPKQAKAGQKQAKTSVNCIIGESRSVGGAERREEEERRRGQERREGRRGE